MSPAVLLSHLIEKYINLLYYLCQSLYVDARLFLDYSENLNLLQPHHQRSVFQLNIHIYFLLPYYKVDKI